MDKRGLVAAAVSCVIAGCCHSIRLSSDKQLQIMDGDGPSMTVRYDKMASRESIGKITTPDFSYEKIKGYSSKDELCREYDDHVPIVITADNCTFARVTDADDFMTELYNVFAYCTVTLIPYSFPQTFEQEIVYTFPGGTGIVRYKGKINRSMSLWPTGYNVGGAGGVTTSLYSTRDVHGTFTDWINEQNRKLVINAIATDFNENHRDEYAKERIAVLSQWDEVERQREMVKKEELAKQKRLDEEKRIRVEREEKLKVEREAKLLAEFKKQAAREEAERKRLAAIEAERRRQEAEAESERKRREADRERRLNGSEYRRLKSWYDEQLDYNDLAESYFTHPNNEFYALGFYGPGGSRDIKYNSVGGYIEYPRSMDKGFAEKLLRTRIRMYEIEQGE